jgi:excisionase family DNA binding protein
MSTVGKGSISEAQEVQINELHKLLKSKPATLTSPDGLHQLELPETLYRLLLKIVENLADGNTGSLSPASQAVSTQQAAALLGMSRQFLISLLNKREIPYHRVGTHRRLKLEDILIYRRKRDEERHEAINEMAKQAVDAEAYDDF